MLFRSAYLELGGLGERVLGRQIAWQQGRRQVRETIATYWVNLCFSLTSLYLPPIVLKTISAGDSGRQHAAGLLLTRTLTFGLMLVSSVCSKKKRGKEFYYLAFVAVPMICQLNEMKINSLGHLE